MQSTKRLLGAVSATLLALVFSACSGDSPAGPTPITPITTTLRAISGETGQPVSGAQLRVYSPSPMTLSTNAEGKVTVENLPANAKLDWSAQGYVSWGTVNDRTDHVLWPMGPNGMTYIANIPYRGTRLPAYRIIKWAGKTRFNLDSSLRSSPAACACFEGAANWINSLAGKQVAFSSSNSAFESGMLDVPVSLNSATSAVGGVGAGISYNDAGNITNIQVFVKDIKLAEDCQKIVRVMAISYGLADSGAPSVTNGLLSPTPEDELAIRMITVRPAGSYLISGGEQDPRYTSGQ